MAQLLLEKKAVIFSPSRPFTYASGRQGPLYCDNRQLLGYPVAFKQVGHWLSEQISELAPNAQSILGVATAGIPHATMSALELGLPTGYLREKPKVHGRSNQIEGFLAEGSQVVVVEDLINSGKSSWAATEALLAKGHGVLGLFCLVDYEFSDAHQLFKSKGIPIFALTCFTQLLEEALAQGMIKEEDRTTLLRWHANPDSWTAQ